ncbi:hypothetical protein [Phaffia rhodozyma]|uniref:Uncharacterized protein n=1 Tax=Phaffia rhodozyma TaxID=264483 RepID=A0A0F7SWK6_PHARH|nr:hypothetical protein [Phaffia rhodozyma]
MARTPTAPAKPAGKKITFDNDSSGDESASPNPMDLTEGALEVSDDDDESQDSSENEDDDDDEDDDDAPEEETMASGKKTAEEQTRIEEEIKEQAKQNRRLAASKRQKASVPKASSKTVTLPEEPVAGPSYLPESIFADAAKEKAEREQKEAEELAQQEKEKERADGRKRRRKDDGEPKARKRVGDTSVRLLNEAGSNKTLSLTPAPAPRRIKAFKKQAYQLGEVVSDPLRSKMAVGRSNVGEASGSKQRGGREQLGRNWVRKEAHLTQKRSSAGPAVGFFTGRLAK